VLTILIPGGTRGSIAIFLLITSEPLLPPCLLSLDINDIHHRTCVQCHRYRQFVRPYSLWSRPKLDGRGLLSIRAGGSHNGTCAGQKASHIVLEDTRRRNGRTHMELCSSHIRPRRSHNLYISSATEPRQWMPRHGTKTSFRCSLDWLCHNRCS
jgi:hypothetical protein